MPKKIKRLNNKICRLPFAVTGGLLFGGGGPILFGGGGSAAAAVALKNENTS